MYKQVAEGLREEKGTLASGIGMNGCGIGNFE